jgi:hypothetical protein
VIRRLLLSSLLLVTLTSTSEAQRRGGSRSHTSSSYRAPRATRSYRAPRISHSTRTYRAPRSSTSRRVASRPRTYTPRISSHSTRTYRAPRANTVRRSTVHVASRPRSTPRSHSYTPRISRRTSTATVGVARDSRGRIRRSESARRSFMRSTGYSRGRPGYVVDHIRPLACGGADAPSNMQWQTREAAKAKDRTERIGCGSRRR